jgi:hypothetical protein
MSEQYYDNPFEANEVDWSKEDDEGYLINKEQDANNCSNCDELSCYRCVYAEYGNFD